jgi:hypothetical protein
VPDNEIDLGNVTDDRSPQQTAHPRTLLLVVAVLAIVAVLSTVTTIVALRKVPQPTLAPVATQTAAVPVRQVQLAATGAAVYYDASSPGLDSSGSGTPVTLALAVGTYVVLLAVAGGSTDDESVCSIKVGGARVAGTNGFGAFAESVCTVRIR